MRLNVRAQGNPAAPPLILLHGLFGAARNLAALQTRLSATHHVLVLDLRNHGASPHARDMTYPTLAADVAETMDHLAIPRCTLLGHSMGGKVAMRLALDAPDRVERLLVADIAPVRYDTGFAVLAAAMQRLPLPPGLTRTAADAALAVTVPDPAIRAFLLQNLRTGPDPGWRIALDAVAVAMPDIMDWPAAASVYSGPTLFVAGSRSDYIRPAHRAVIHALFPAATFTIVADAGHWLHADNPDGFHAAVATFIGRNDPLVPEAPDFLFLARQQPEDPGLA